MHRMTDDYYVLGYIDMDIEEDAFTESAGELPGLSTGKEELDAERTAIMHEFRNIVGYENLKNEMVQLCDIMRNRNCYDKVSARIPRGLFLYGMPGVGKTSMAEAVARASARPVIRLRRTAAGEKFIEEIKDSFRSASEQAPSVLLMDDIDKYADDSDSYGTPAEYAVIQTCIDEMGDSDVFLIATANKMGAIPESLIRQGRFDRKRKVSPPSLKDSEKILGLYLSDNVKVSDDLDMKTLAVMAFGSSCAFIESLANEAAVLAGYERSDEITMYHFIKAWQRYRGHLIRCELSQEEKLRTAYYQAGKTVLTAVIAPQALTLTYAGLRYGADDFEYLSSLPLYDGDDMHKYAVMRLLAGRAAEELHYGNFDDQCSMDIKEAYEMVIDMILGGNEDYLEVEQVGFREISSELMAERISNSADAAIQELYQETLTVMKENEVLLDRVVEGLMENDYLLAEDIRHIQKEINLAA